MKITFIQTGGTIDKHYPHTIKGWAFEIHDPAFDRVLERLNPSFEYEVLSALKKDSLEITEEDRAHLKQVILDSGSDRIVITHGTDTMEETAKYLADLDKTIVITEAMRPERFSNSDADINIGMAIATVQTAKSGVYICMHGWVMRHDEVDRNMESGQYLKG